MPNLERGRAEQNVLRLIWCALPALADAIVVPGGIVEGSFLTFCISFSEFLGLIRSHVKVELVLVSRQLDTHSTSGEVLL